MLGTAQFRPSCFRLSGGTSHPFGSRSLIVANARRKSLSRELQELRQLKDSPPPPTPPAPAPATSPAALSTTTAAFQAPPTAPTATAPPSPTPAQPVAAASPPDPVPGTTGNALFDNLLFRILASVTAIMAVISVFYSIVFYGASNAVYIFKDQLATITKKDFVPYSERRRLEQELLAKLEAEQQERLSLRAEAGSDEGAAAAPGSSAGVASSSELLTLLPSSTGRKQ